MPTVTPPADQDSAASRASAAAFPGITRELISCLGTRQRACRAILPLRTYGKRPLRQASHPQCPLLAPGLLQNLHVLCLLGHQLLYARLALSGSRRYLVSEGFLQGNSRALCTLNRNVTVHQWRLLTDMLSLRKVEQERQRYAAGAQPSRAFSPLMPDSGAP